MKSFATIMFASGAIAAMAPPAYYPAPSEYSSAPAVYPTGSVPSKNPHESAPYPYPTEKKETKTHKSVDTTCTESATDVYVTKTYEHEHKPTHVTKTIVYTHGANTYTVTETEVVVIPTYAGHNQESSKTEVVVIPTYAGHNQESSKTEVVVIPTYAGHNQEASKTVVIVSPTPYHQGNGNNGNNGNDMNNGNNGNNMNNGNNGYKHETVTEIKNVYVTAPAVCVPAAEQTVTVTSSLTITVSEAKPTGYETVIVTPVQYSPTAPGSYAPVNPSYVPVSPINPYGPAGNGTTTVVAKPTYSAPVQYTGAAVKTGAGFGALAIAVIALVL